MKTILRTLTITGLLLGCTGKSSKISPLVDPRTGVPANDPVQEDVPPEPLPQLTEGPTPATTEPRAPTMPAIPETIKPVAEVVDINTTLEVSRRGCKDPNFGRGNLEACLSSEPVLSRFDTVNILFSLTRASGRIPEEMLRKLLEKNFTMVDQQGKKVEGRLIWKDLRTVMFDPAEELKPNHRYRITILSPAKDPSRPRSNQGRILTPFEAEVSTQAAFTMNHTINGKVYPLGRGLSLDSSASREIKVSSSIDTPALAQRISIRRLGTKAEKVLCEGNCADSVLAFGLSGENLAPIPGLNSYEYRIDGKLGEAVYRHFSLAWGEWNKTPEAPIENGVNAAIDRENGLQALSRLIGEYAAGRFTMDYRDEKGGVHPKQSFNDIIRFKRARFGERLPGQCDEKADTDFEYLENLGPYCGLKVEGETGVLGGVLGKVKYKAVTDIYVTDMQVLAEQGNVEAALIPETENLKMKLGVKKYKGRLRIVLRINEAKYFGAVPVPGATGFFFYDTDFYLDGPIRDTIAKSDLTVENGRLRLKIRGSDTFDMTQTIHGSEDAATYFNTQLWTQNTTVEAVTPIDENKGLWAKLVNTVVNQAVNSQVDSFKPQIVNGIARDILQVVAPNALNTLVEQLKTGLQIFLPAHLPSPIDRTKIKVAGQIGKNIGFDVREDNSYLTTSVKMNLSSIIDKPYSRPAALDGITGFLKTSQGQKAPSPLAAGETYGDGSLLSVSIDVVNQLLYDVWKQGMLGLKIDNDFVNKVEQFAVFDPINQANGKEILLAEFLPKLMGSDITRMQGRDVEGKPVTMEKSDRISISVDARLPPFLKAKRVPRGDGKDDLRFALGMGHVLMTIEGLHNNQRYSIAKLRMAVTADSQLKFVPYQNPMRHPEFSGLGALSVEVDKNPDTLDYMVEVVEGPEANSFAIDTSKLRTTINDMVDRLFIPLLNDGLREVPLTGLRVCGVELDASQMEILPIPHSEGTPYLLIKAPLKNYDFAGHCDLLPDLTSPLPPLPPEEEKPEEEPTSPGSETETPGSIPRVDLNMNFGAIPWTLNGKGKAPGIDEGCKTQIFFDVSCSVASVVYEEENGVVKLDDRGRPIYSYTAITLATLVPKTSYALKGPSPSIEAQFFDFAKWKEYVVGSEDHIVINESIQMSDIDTQYGRFRRHYVEFETNSPKASGFIPIRDVTLHRVLEKPFEGAEVSTEFFVDTSSSVATPSGKPLMKGAEGLDFHVGNTHIYECGKLPWCQDSSQWLVIYDTRLRPNDKSIPEDVVPYLKAALNAIIAGMFPI